MAAPEHDPAAGDAMAYDSASIASAATAPPHGMGAAAATYEDGGSSGGRGARGRSTPRGRGSKPKTSKSSPNPDKGSW